MPQLYTKHNGIPLYPILIITRASVSLPSTLVYCQHSTQRGPCWPYVQTSVPGSNPLLVFYFSQNKKGRSYNDIQDLALLSLWPHLLYLSSFLSSSCTGLFDAVRTLSDMFLLQGLCTCCSLCNALPLIATWLIRSLLWAELCPPKIYMLTSQSPVPQNVTTFRK